MGGGSGGMDKCTAYTYGVMEEREGVYLETLPPPPLLVLDQL